MQVVSCFVSSLPSHSVLSTALPVIFFSMLLFSMLLVYSVSRVGEFVNKLHVIEKNMRLVAALIFILVGLYYSGLWIFT